MIAIEITDLRGIPRVAGEMLDPRARKERLFIARRVRDANT